MKIETKLKPYIGYSRSGGSEEGACLIFANNCKEAKKLAFEEFKGWFDEQEWIDVAVNKLKGEWLYKEANQENLKNNFPHVVDNPVTCKKCETWGHETYIDGICEDCRELIEDIKKGDREIWI